MRIEQFQYLTDLYHTKSITKTAEKFFISRQVVSHSLREMEKELDLALLERDNNMITFTEVGKIAVQKAEKIVEAYEDFLSITAKRVCPEDNEAQEDILHIYAIPRMISTLLPKCLANYKQLYPHRQVKIYTASPEAVLETMQCSTQNIIGLIAYLDFTGKVSSKPFPLHNHSNIVLQPILESKFYLCMRKSSKYNTKTQYHDKDLATLPLLSFDPAFLTLNNNITIIPMNIISSINDFETMQQLIMQDYGVGLLTLNEFNKLKNHRNLILKPIFSASNTTIYYGCIFRESEYDKLLPFIQSALMLQTVE